MVMKYFRLHDQPLPEPTGYLRGCLRTAFDHDPARIG